MNMKFWNAGTGKPEDVIHVVKNAEAVTIPVGTPVVYAFNGTDDGLAVIFPSTAVSGQVSALCAGVVVKDIPSGKLENVQVYGFNRKTALIRGTRANSTSGWASAAAVSKGEMLGINSAQNGFVASGAASLSNFQPMVVLAEQVSSLGALASSDNGANPASATIYYSLVKTFLRFM